jgi:hypothetical protein
VTQFTRRNLPADITVLHGTFASQPLVFAHLLDVAPTLDLTHVEVIQTNHRARLEAYFDTETARDFPHSETLVLILPAAHEGLACPVSETAHLRPIGTFRGTIPHLSEAP